MNQWPAWFGWSLAAVVLVSGGAMWFARAALRRAPDLTALFVLGALFVEMLLGQVACAHADRADVNTAVDAVCRWYRTLEAARAGEPAQRVPELEALCSLPPLPSGAAGAAPVSQGGSP